MVVGVQERLSKHMSISSPQLSVVPIEQLSTPSVKSREHSFPTLLSLPASPSSPRYGEISKQIHRSTVVLRYRPVKATTVWLETSSATRIGLICDPNPIIDLTMTSLCGWVSDKFLKCPLFSCSASNPEHSHIRALSLTTLNISTIVQAMVICICSDASPVLENRQFLSSSRMEKQMMADI